MQLSLRSVCCSCCLSGERGVPSMRSWCTTVILRRKNQRVGGYRGRTAVRGGLVRIGSAQLAWRQGKAHAAPAMVCILRSVFYPVCRQSEASGSRAWRLRLRAGSARRREVSREARGRLRETFVKEKPQVRVIPAGTTHGPPRKLAKGAALLRSLALQAPSDATLTSSLPSAFR